MWKTFKPVFYICLGISLWAVLVAIKPTPQVLDNDPTMAREHQALDIFLFTPSDVNPTWVQESYFTYVPDWQLSPTSQFLAPLYHLGAVITAIPAPTDRWGQSEGTRYGLSQTVWQYETEVMAEEAFAHDQERLDLFSNLDFPIKGFESRINRYISYCTKEAPFGNCGFIMQKDVYVVRAYIYIGDGIIFEEDWAQAMMAIQAKLLEHTAE